MSKVTKKELFKLVGNLKGINASLRANIDLAHEVSKRIDPDTFKKFRAPRSWPWLVPTFTKPTPSRFPDMARLKKVSKDSAHIDKYLPPLVKDLDDTIFVEQSTPATQVVVAVILKSSLAYYWESHSYRILTIELLKLQHPKIHLPSVNYDEKMLHLSSVSPIDNFSLMDEIDSLRKSVPLVDYKRLVKDAAAIKDAMEIPGSEHNQLLQQAYEAVVRSFINYMDKPSPALESLINITVGQFEKARRMA